MIKVSIDLSKIDKSKIKEGKKGEKYYEIIVDERRQPDNYGNTHTAYESQSKEEREAKKPKNYLGNGKVYDFSNKGNAAPVNTPPAATGTDDKSLPF